jgi:hypothetical protein
MGSLKNKCNSNVNDSYRDEDHATTTCPPPLQLDVSHHLPLHNSGTLPPVYKLRKQPLCNILFYCNISPDTVYSYCVDSESLTSSLSMYVEYVTCFVMFLMFTTKYIMLLYNLFHSVFQDMGPWCSGISQKHVETAHEGQWNACHWSSKLGVFVSMSFRHRNRNILVLYEYVIQVTVKHSILVLQYI